MSTSPAKRPASVLSGRAALSIEDAAEYCAISSKTLRRLIHTNGFPKSRELSRGRVCWLVSELNAWIESRPLSTMLPPPSGATGDE